METATRRDDDDSEVLAGLVLQRLAEEGATIATAESITGGRLARVLTDVAGASVAFLGGVVAYATELKVAILGVPQQLVDGPGVVSPECAEAMASGVRRLTGATYALSTTGVAGPALQEGKPVGTVYVGLAGPRGARVEPGRLAGDRNTIRTDTCAAALALLVAELDAGHSVEGKNDASGSVGDHGTQEG